MYIFMITSIHIINNFFEVFTFVNVGYFCMQKFSLLSISALHDSHSFDDSDYNVSKLPSRAKNPVQRPSDCTKPSFYENIHHILHVFARTTKRASEKLPSRNKTRCTNVCEYIHMYLWRLPK